MPFAGYDDFDDCVRQNRDMDDPAAYCAWLERRAGKASQAEENDDMKLRIVPVADMATKEKKYQDENGDGIDDITGEPVAEIAEDIAEDIAEESTGNILETDISDSEDFHALLVVEGVWTGDGRWIEEEALSWRELPLPLMATDRTTEGHMDARLIGSITRIERDGREIHGYGRFVQSDDAEIMRLQDFVRAGDLRGVSVDLDSVEYEIVVPASEMARMIGPLPGDEINPDPEETAEPDGNYQIIDGQCPPATADIAINLENRQNAIDTAGYGPLNPAESNDEFWQAKADRWNVTIEEARKQTCSNCVMFVVTPEMRACIEEGLTQGGSSEEDAWSAIDAGDLGYCEAFDFKCAGARTCDAWVAGGPITESRPVEEVEVEVEETEAGMRRDENGNGLFEVEDYKMRVTSARIMGATVVPFPAFEEAYIESTAGLTAALMANPGVSGHIEAWQNLEGIDFRPPEGAREEATRGLEWRQEYGRGGTAVGVARARDIANGRNLSPETITRMTSYFARHEVDKKGQGWSPGEDGYPSAGRIAWALWGGDPGRTWAEKVRRQMDTRKRDGSIVASAHPIQAPVVPPASWFADPGLAGPTPMTIDDSGRIYGHLATWETCHRGYADSCVRPPRSQASYSHFLTGELLLEDGSRVAVGQITMDTGHAPLYAQGQKAAAHYDDTGLVVADITCGEDRWGIWMAGSLRPDVAPEKVRALMASDVSGDWRRIGSGLELIAILAVNVPGFHKNRVSIREDEGLVASMVATLGPGEPQYHNHLASSDQRRVMERIAASIGRSTDQRIAELRARVHAGGK